MKSGTAKNTPHTAVLEMIDVYAKSGSVEKVVI